MATLTTPIADRQMFRIVLERLCREGGFEYVLNELAGVVEADLPDMPVPQSSHHFRLAERIKNLRQWWLAEKERGARSVCQP